MIVVVDGKEYDCTEEMGHFIDVVLKLGTRLYYGRTDTKWHDGRPTITEKYDKILHRKD